MFRILSIDGGGIRGIFPAYILKCIEERLGINVYDTFDMFAGASTGAIVAAAIADKRKPDEIVNLYRKHGAEIFGAPIRSIWHKKLKQLFHSKYDNQPLQRILEKEFANKTLRQLEKPALLPATNIGHGDVHVFKSAYSKEFTRDLNVPIAQAVLASCSAPTFFDPVRVGEFHLADGGVWANNPSLAAVLDARKRLGVETRDIQILSIGTGHTKSFYGTNTDKKWGFACGWERQKFIEMILSLQTQSTHNYLKIFLQPNQWLRINFDSQLELPLDDTAGLDDLVAEAAREFAAQSAAIDAFLNA